MISIIIPALNEENYLPILLDSLAKQTFSGFEVVVVDGGSKDKTRAAAKSYNFVKVVKSTVRNISFQRDLGVEAAKYNQLLFLDADGYVKPRFLEKALAEIKNRKLEVAGCYLYPHSHKLFYRFVYFAFRNWIRFLSNIRLTKLNGGAIFSTKDIHRKIGGFNNKITFDYTQKAGWFCRPKLLDSVKLYTSVRRFETEGKLKTAFNYLFLGGYITFIGNPGPGKFKWYKFNHYKKKMPPV
jgi:glycosyltransferase involved in cell wall biosynthesis